LTSDHASFVVGDLEQAFLSILRKHTETDTHKPESFKGSSKWIMASKTHKTMSEYLTFIDNKSTTIEHVLNMNKDGVSAKKIVITL
jgi:hypothetical protein